MSARTWKDVWQARRLDPARGSTLAQLLAAGGRDTGFGDVGEDAWRRHVAETAATLGIVPGSSVFEVGCGAGAYLVELERMGCVVGGLDFSAALLGYARQVMPRARFMLGEAVDLDVSERYDFVVASAVFLYFPSLDYARRALDRMVRKARRGVMVLDVPDLARHDEAMALRRGWSGEAEYARRYEGLDHRYFPRDWFEAALADLGVERMRIDDQRIEGYTNSAFRYNVFAWCP